MDYMSKEKKKNYFVCALKEWKNERKKREKEIEDAN